MKPNDDVEKCLTSLGIEKRHIIPTNIAQRVLRQRPELNQFRNEIIFPLEWFDSDSGNDSKVFLGCREGLAFLPDSSLQQSLEINPDDFEWRKVTVEKHNETANKWRIKELQSGAVYEVPRIYLMFIAEAPFIFAQRIHRAKQWRAECEHRLKFEAVVDRISLSEIPKPPQRVCDNIGKLLRQHSFNRDWMEVFEAEHCILYQKTLAAMELITFWKSDPHSSPSIQLPSTERRSKWKSLTTNNGSLTKTIFEKSRSDFQRMWLFCCPEAIKIMEFINKECADVSRMSLFHIQTNETWHSLTAFVNANNETLTAMSNYLHREWIEKVAGEVKRQLVGIRGWLDLNVNDWSIYRMSKLHRLIELMRHRLEVAVGLVLRSSLKAFVNHLCQPCESMLSIPVEFAWGNDLLASRFSAAQPVFDIDLDFDDGNEPAYTTDAERFGLKIVEMFTSRVLTTHEIPQIDPYLVTQLKFDKSLRLTSIGLLDDDVQGQIRHLQRCYEACLIPLRAYAREFRQFIVVKTLNVADYVRSCKGDGKTSEEMKREISHQLMSIDEIELTVPQTIVIGPFRINVALKKDLIVKRRNLVDSLVVMFADVVREKVNAINREFNDVYAKLTNKCETVEELVTVRDWLPGIPDEVAFIEAKTKKLSVDFDVLESFLVGFSDDVIMMWFTVKNMPKRILNAIDSAQQKLQFDFELFRKLQAFHEVQFMEKIESLAVDVEAYSSEHNFDDLSRVASDIDKLWSVLNEMMMRAEMLNNRQQIFNQPEIDMERLTVFVHRLHPHHTLWTMASNFLRSRHDWTSSPLLSVDIDLVEAEVKRCENVVQESRLHFALDSEMTVLIEKISSLVDDVNKLLVVMRDLRNHDFEAKHWAMLTEQTPIHVEDLQTVTFDGLLAWGVMEYADVIKQISVEATREREARILDEIKAKRKRQQEEQLKEQRKARRAGRKDI